MSQDTEKLAHEAEAKRSSVESTIEELRSRMSVGQIVDELSGYMRDGQAGAMAQNLGRQVRDNPLALGLVGAGIAWLLMGDGIREGGRRIADHHGGDDVDDVAARMSGRYPHDPVTTDMHDGAYSGQNSMRTSSMGHDSGAKSGSTPSGIADRLTGAASTVSAGVSSASSRAGSAASSVGQGARRLGHDALDATAQAERAAMQRAQSVGRRAQRLGGNARRTFVDTLQEEPLVVGALALAIGAAIGASLPSTQIEDDYLGDARDGLRDQAVDYGKDALESGKRVAERTYQAASHEAEERGLTSAATGETLTEKVAGVANVARETARTEAHREGLV